AISALPPLNGFVSEWLTFQAILISPQLPSWGLKFLVPAVGALLALSAALAAACFVKAFGVTFLGRPRTPAVEGARETDRFSLAALAIHRLASDRLRRAPAWDCGYPDPSPATQYTADSFAQPIRRVFGTVVFRAREKIEMPPPGDLRPARLTVEMRDLIWDLIYVPVASGVGFAADRLNHLQFLTIRQFLSLVLAALVLLLLVLA